jgi:formylglycine-generating enzyme required for sulfatase activity
MVFLPGGTFRMGCKTGGSDEKPVHEVTLKGFYISACEITQHQWRAVMQDDTTFRYFEGCNECPVERVSWYNVMEFISKLNNATGKSYRLPTEAEWEFAARGGTRSMEYKFSGSDDSDSAGWTVDNAQGRTHPVGMKKPNEAGIFDMTGNVAEWCSDWYYSSWYSVSPALNPGGPMTGTQKVVRGGSWYYDSSGLRSTDRGIANPNHRYGFIGFRLCLSE